MKGKTQRYGTRRAVRLAATTAVMAMAAGLSNAISWAGETRALPAPEADEAAEGPSEAVVLAGGCFWGVQGVFQHVDGVISAVSGYAGGEQRSAHYEMVGTGSTGHAESVQVTFDPRKISYGRILQIYFSVAHDPTQLNRQGPDRGAQYRSAIFPATPEQGRIAGAYIAQLNRAHVFDNAIVTKIEPSKFFYPAERYHQNFLTNNPDYPYIVINDLPKIEALRRLYPDLYRKEPALVSSLTTQ